MDKHVGEIAKRVGELEESAQFLSTVVEEAAAERGKLSRDVQEMHDRASRTRDQPARVSGHLRHDTL